MKFNFLLGIYKIQIHCSQKIRSLSIKETNRNKKNIYL